MESQEQYLPLKIKSRGRFYGELFLGALAVLFVYGLVSKPVTAKASPVLAPTCTVSPMIARPAEATARPLTVMEQIKVQCAVKWTDNGITNFRMVKYCIDQQVKAAQELGAL